MTLKELLLAGSFCFAAASANVFVGMPAQAACLSSSTYNNCQTYNTVSSPIRAIVQIPPSSVVDTNGYWQLTGSTSTIGNFSNWEYGSNGTSWTSFDPGFATNGSNQVGTIFTNLTTPPAPAGNPFYIRVTLSDTATLNAQFLFTFLSNSDGSVDDFGRLSIDSENALATSPGRFTRVADPVPGPLPLVGALAAFGYSRKLRKACIAQVNL
jgi:hypothetical protein